MHNQISSSKTQIEIQTKQANQNSQPIDLGNSKTLSLLVNSLLLSCVPDSSINLCVILGQYESCCNRHALSCWVIHETQCVTFHQRHALFTFLAIQLDAIIYERGQSL